MPDDKERARLVGKFMFDACRCDCHDVPAALGGAGPCAGCRGEYGQPCPTQMLAAEFSAVRSEAYAAGIEAAARECEARMVIHIGQSKAWPDPRARDAMEAECCANAIRSLATEGRT